MTKSASNEPNDEGVDSMQLCYEAYLPGIGETLLREQLKLTPEERFLKHQRMMELMTELQAAGRRARGET